MMWYLFFSFNREIIFTMHLSSNQVVPNPGRVAPVMIILVPTFQWTRTNLPLRPWISSTRSLFMITFRLDWLSRSSHHGLTVYPNSWVLFPLFRYECVSVPTRMRLSVPVMSVSIISGLLIISSTHI